jgi:predicted RNA binding protein YcfA (HicA-like mRNA interferase family)
MKVKEAIKLIEHDGWYMVRQKGSHIQFKHTTKKGLVTIACNRMSDEIARGTMASILRQAQIDKTDIQ